MVSNVARLTRSLRDTFLEESSTSNGAAPTVSAPRSAAGHAAPAPFAPRAEFSTTTLSEKINAVRRELLQSGEAIFTDDRGNRFHIERKPA
jgi:hypothetical protein